MTSPEDDLEEALRQALAAALDQVQPGTEGLERIRAKIGTRPPRPWLLSVAAGAYERARNWTWRGHWAWDSLSRPATLSWPRLLRLPQSSSRSATNRSARVIPPAGAGWLRPVAVLAGIAVIASISLGVQPFRQAIIQASTTVLSGGGQRGGAGTDGNGTPAGTGNGSSPVGSASGGAASPGHGGTAMTSSSPTPTGASPAGCATMTAELTNAPPTASAADASSTSATAVSVVPTAIPSALPYYSPTPTCAASTSTATPSPTASSDSPGASPTPSTSGASPTSSATPSSSPSQSPSPTSSATPSATVSPTASPSDVPTPTATASGTGTDTPGAGTPTAPVS